MQGYNESTVNSNLERKMIDSMRSRLSHSLVEKYLVTMIAPAIFMVLVIFFYPARTQFQIDNDEGVELMKAMLVDKGYAPHEEIWSEHPPLLTYMLAAGFRLVGYKVGFSRYIILVLSLLLMWASGNILRMIWDTRVSLFGQSLFLFLPNFLLLSVTVMNGLPSISFAVLSLWTLLEWHQNRKFPWLLVSALFLGLSVLTKISLAFLGPLFCLGLLIGEVFSHDKRFKPSHLLPPLVFGLVFSLVLTTGAWLLIGWDNLSQLWDMFVPESQILNLEYRDINYYMLKALPWVILAGIGVYCAIKQRIWLALYPLAWAVVGYILLLNHSPVWGHHQLNITVPLVLLAAFPVSNAVERFWKILTSDQAINIASVLLVISIFATLAILLPYGLPESIKLLDPFSFFNPTVMDPQDEMVMAHMGLYKDQTEWVVTDKPIFAFRSRLLVPPEIAMFSKKRLAVGGLTETEVILVIEQYQPEQVLIWRFNLPEVKTYLEEHYQPIYTIGNRGLWLRSDIKPKPIN